MRANNPKHTYSHLLLGSVFYISLLFPGLVRADTATPGGPLEAIKATVDQVVAINESLPGDASLTQRREKLRAVITPRFDFDEMARRSLGTNWSAINADQQAEFVKVFSDLLAKTYLARVESAKTGMVKIENEKITPGNPSVAVVKTQVMSKGDSFPIDYKLVDEHGTWKVYDVVIENIGLIVNYRNEFSGIIRKDKFDGLMARLRERAA